VADESKHLAYDIRAQVDALTIGQLLELMVNARSIGANLSGEAQEGVREVYRHAVKRCRYLRRERKATT
jgi:hypothetical protein